MPAVFKSVAFHMASEDMARQFLRHFDPLISEWTGRTEVDPRALEVISRDDCLLLPTTPSHAHESWSHRVPVYCLRCEEYHNTWGYCEVGGPSDVRARVYRWRIQLRWLELNMLPS